MPKVDQADGDAGTMRQDIWKLTSEVKTLSLQMAELRADITGVLKACEMVSVYAGIVAGSSRLAARALMAIAAGIVVSLVQHQAAVSVAFDVAKRLSR